MTSRDTTNRGLGKAIAARQRFAWSGNLTRSEQARRVPETRDLCHGNEKHPQRVHEGQILGWPQFCARPQRRPNSGQVPYRERLLFGVDFRFRATLLQGTILVFHFLAIPNLADPLENDLVFHANSLLDDKQVVQFVLDAISR